MKKIELTQGKYALVDNDYFEKLSKWKWCYGARGYAYRGDGSKTRPRVWMHREILQTPSDLFTDHINGNKLDNRRLNLRAVTHAQNTKNRHSNILPQESGLRGVYPVTYKTSTKWWSYITNNKVRHYLGVFETKEEAAKAHRRAAERYHQEFSSVSIK